MADFSAEHDKAAETHNVIVVQWKMNVEMIFKSKDYSEGKGSFTQLEETV